MEHNGPHTAQELIRLLDEAKEAMRPWASGNDPNDVYARQTWQMASAHATFFGTLRHILEIGPDIPAQKMEYFAGYCLQWVCCVEHHHFYEEELYYPKFALAMNTKEIVKEHIPFKAGLVEMEEYLTSCLPKGSPYGYEGKLTTKEKLYDFDIYELERIIWTFIIPFKTHLTAEIGYLHPDILRARHTYEEMKAIDDWNDSYFKNQLPLDTFLIFLVLHVPTWSGFPPAPWFVKILLCRWIVYWKWRCWWQFAPSNPE